MSDRATLTLEQCKKLLAVMPANDHSLFLALLTCGAEARTWSWEDAVSHSLDMPIALFHEIKAVASKRSMVLPSFGSLNAVHMLGCGESLKNAIWTAKGASAPLTTQEVSRRAKRYARKAGISMNTNLRTIVNSHHALSELFGDVEAFCEALQPVADHVRPVLGGKHQKDPRFHGLGRRSFASVTR